MNVWFFYDGSSYSAPVINTGLTLTVTSVNHSTNVLGKYAMFNEADNFNQDIGAWDVSNVTDMKRMFHRADDFNQDLSDWDVNNVTSFSLVFGSDTGAGGGEF